MPHAEYPQPDLGRSWDSPPEQADISHHRSLRVVICDSHPVVLIGLRALLQEQGTQFEVVGEATHGKCVIELLSRVSCDLLIIDLALGAYADSEDGLQLLGTLYTKYPTLPVIVLTSLHNPALIHGMLAAGARGIVDKVALAYELIRGIYAVSRGRIYLSQSAKEKLAKMPFGTSRKSTLSTREAAVVRLFAQGFTVTQIAQRNDRSTKTISQQKRKAMRKLGIEGDKQLHDYAREIGLV